MISSTNYVEFLATEYLKISPVELPTHQGE